MQEGLRETRISREIENAAFVGTTTTTLVSGPLQAGEWLQIHVHVVNTGKTPAFNLIVVHQGWMMSPIDPSQFIAPPTESVPKGRSTVTPGADNVVSFWIPKLTQEDVDAINGFQKFIYIWATIEYDDIFGKHHWTKFCLMHHPTMITFDSCAHGNECDYQYRADEKMD